MLRLKSKDRGVDEIMDLGSNSPINLISSTHPFNKDK